MTRCLEVVTFKRMNASSQKLKGREGMKPYFHCVISNIEKSVGCLRPPLSVVSEWLAWGKRSLD